LKEKHEIQEREIAFLKAEGQMQSKLLLQAQHEISTMKDKLARFLESSKPLVSKSIEFIPKPYQLGANISQGKSNLTG